VCRSCPSGLCIQCHCRREWPRGLEFSTPNTLSVDWHPVFLWISRIGHVSTSLSCAARRPQFALLLPELRSSCKICLCKCLTPFMNHNYGAEICQTRNSAATSLWKRGSWNGWKHCKSEKLIWFSCLLWNGYLMLVLLSLLFIYNACELCRDLSSNNLEGEIPSHWGQCTTLRSLCVNLLHPCIPIFLILWWYSLGVVGN